MKYIVHIERHSTDQFEVEAENREQAQEMALTLAKFNQFTWSDDSVFKVQELPPSLNVGFVSGEPSIRGDGTGAV